MADKIRFITLNVRGITDLTKRNKFMLWIKNQKAQIAFLQETYCTINNFEKFNRTFKEHGFTRKGS